MTSLPTASDAPAVPTQLGTRRVILSDRVTLGLITALLILWLVAIVALPLGLLLVKSLQTVRGEFVGLENYARYVSTPTLVRSLWNSLAVSAISTAI